MLNKEILEVKIEEQNLVIQELNSFSGTIENEREKAKSKEIKEFLGLTLKEVNKNLEIEEFILNELNTDFKRFE